MKPAPILPIVLATLLILRPGARAADAPPALRSNWIDPARVMVIYNTVKMDSVDPAEADTFSHDIGAWYMETYGMPTEHLFGFDMGKKVRWENPGAFDLLQAVADYILQNDIQIVLMAPGTPLTVRDTKGNANLALDSLTGHALWFAKVKKEAPACTERRSITNNTSNLYFPYLDMGDGASPFVKLTRDASRWCPDGGQLHGYRQWYQTMMMDLRDHPSVRPFGRIGLPYYLEIFPNRPDKKGKVPGPELDIPLENSKFVKDLVLGGIAATTSIKEFNAQSERSLLFFGREGNTASFIDVESALCEAMAQDAILQGVAPDRIARITTRSKGWYAKTCLPEPVWDGTASAFLNGTLSPPASPLIFSGGGVGNITETVQPWPNSLDVKPGLVASASVSNGKAFSGSLLRRGATTMVVNIQHPQNARLHAWLSVHQQLVGGATVAEAMIAGGGSPRGGYISGSVWGDPLYAPFGKNPAETKEDWFTGGGIAPAAPAEFTARAMGSSYLRILLGWSPTDLAARYRIERRTAGGGGNFAKIADLSATLTYFQDITIAPGNAYEYRVRAYNTAGESDWVTKGVTVSSSPTPPAQK